MIKEGGPIYNKNTSENSKQINTNPIAGLTLEQQQIRQSIIEKIKNGESVNLEEAFEKILTEEERNFWNYYITKILYTQPVNNDDRKRFEYLTIRLGLREKENNTTSSVLQEVNKIIELQRTLSEFIPSRHFPSPSVFTGREIDDVAAVIAGIKPSAIVTAIDAYKDFYELLFNRALQEGYVIVEAVGFGGRKMYIIGKAETVEKILRLGEPYWRGDKTIDEHYHRELGRLLGYPEEAIEDFIKNFNEKNRE